MDSETLAATPLYERITQDMGAVTLEFQAWWDAMAQKYGWVPVEGRNWTIDFASCEIRLE
jgi:CXXX repeat modification system protein